MVLEHINLYFDKSHKTAFSLNGLSSTFPVVLTYKHLLIILQKTAHKHVTRYTARSFRLANTTQLPHASYKPKPKCLTFEPATESRTQTRILLKITKSTVECCLSGMAGLRLAHYHCQVLARDLPMESH